MSYIKQKKEAAVTETITKIGGRPMHEHMPTCSFGIYKQQ